jgi:hypothetical protein
MEAVLEKPEPARDAGGSLDVERPVQATDLAAALRQIAGETGVSLVRLVQDFARLAFGPGRISFDEYVALRLFDDERYAGVDKRQFVGLEMNRRLSRQANYRQDWYGLAADKVASSGYLAAYGLPVIAVLKILSDRPGVASPNLLRDAADLRAFLTQAQHYPLFGKPTDAYQSLGSASLDGYDPATDSVVALGGRRIALDAFIADLLTHYAGGYLFQKRVAPHPDVRRICGERLATVRLMTIPGEEGPQVLRACWKIPAGANAADNFWRPGNLLAQLDLSTGRVLRVVRGTGLNLTQPTHHPESGAPIVGTEVPSWPEILRLARAGAALFPDLPLIGWDIAPVEGGAVIVELNETPDFILPQLADGRGMMDETFARFIAARKSHEENWKRSLKRRYKDEIAQRWRALRNHGARAA